MKASDKLTSFIIKFSLIGLLVVGETSLGYLFAQDNSTDPSQNKIRIDYRLRYDWKMTNQELYSLQYYIGSTLKFKRIKSTTDTQKDLSNAERSISTTIYGQEVTLSKWTPGIAVDVGIDFIQIDFGDGVKIVFEKGYGQFRVWDGATIKINKQKYLVEIVDPGNKDQYGEYVYLYTDKLSTVATNHEEIDKKNVSGRTLKK
jgi:hypothetical protein